MKSWESWRLLADEGRCIRGRSLLTEMRRVYHPKQATFPELMKAIPN